MLHIRLLRLLAICFLSVPLSAAAYDSFDQHLSSDATSRTPNRASYLLAGLSEAVYDSGKMLRKRVKNLGLKFVGFKVRRGKSAQAVIAMSDRYILVAVRGSKEPIDLLQDLRSAHTRKWTNRKLSVHAGFADQADALYPWVVRQLRAKRGRRKLILTGHSLGAAVAQLLAYRLQRSGDAHVDQVMVFAAPRIGGKTWKSNYDKLLLDRTSSWVNQHDPIPHMPSGSSWKSVGKRHVIRMRGSNNKAKRTLCESKCKTKSKKKKRRACRKRCDNQWRDKRESPKINFFAGSIPDKNMTAVGDHKMPTYLRRIWDGMSAERRRGMPSPQVVDPNR